jgi:endonuclease/exonuclease/phosphatase family metal-dependent hydrolase
VALQATKKKTKRRLLPKLTRRKSAKPSAKQSAKPVSRKTIVEGPNVRPFRVLSYNIHQGLTVAKRKLTLGILKDAIKSLKVDLVLLQEVAGIQGVGGKKYRAAEALTETSFQLEALADEMWPFYAYGRNSIFSGGFHGNAILSAFPIMHYKNIDISIAKRGLVRRGILHAELNVPGQNTSLHVLATHFGLLQAERQRQLKHLVQYVNDNIPQNAPVILGGDFNDWRETISGKLSKAVGFREAFMEMDAKHARTFPSQFPVLKLDRIYFRHLRLRTVERVSGRPWLFLSDHLPLVGEFDF